MSYADTILTTLQSQLEDHANLSYLKGEKVLLGLREHITQFPCIVIEYIGQSEEDYTYNTQNIILRLAIIGFIECHVKDKQIVGDGTIKGIMDLENDIKKAIDSDRTIGGNAIHTYITDTDSDVEFPIRFSTITIEIHYRQTSNVRT